MKIPPQKRRIRRAFPSIGSSSYHATALFVTAAAMFGAAAAAQGADVIHNLTPGSTGNWSDTSLWTNGVPNAAGDIARNSSGVSATTLDINVIIGSIRNDAGSAGNWTITQGGAFTFTLDGTGISAGNQLFGNAGVAGIGSTASGTLTIGASGAGINLVMSNTDLDIGMGANTNSLVTFGDITATTNQTLSLRNNTTVSSQTLTINGNVGATGTGSINVQNVGTGNKSVTITGNVGPMVSGLTQNTTGAFTISGAANVVNGTANVLAGTLNLTGAATTINGTLNVDAGTLDLQGGQTVTASALTGTTGTVTSANGGAGLRTLSLIQNTNTTFGGVLTDSSNRTFTLLKNGTGTLTLTGANTFGSGLTVNGGTVSLDRSSATAPAQIIGTGFSTVGLVSPLSLGGGTLSLVGNSTTAGTQAFNGTTLNSGASTLSIGTAGAGQSLTLGTLTRNVGSVLRIVPPTTGTISTAAPTAAGLLFDAATNSVPYGYYNGSDFAGRDASGNFVAGATVATYTPNPTGTGNILLGASYTATVLDFVNGSPTTGVRLNSTTAVINGLRFNAPNSSGTWFIDTSAVNRLLSAGAILMTPNLSTTNVTISGAGGIRALNANKDLILMQEDTSSLLSISSGIMTGTSSSVTQLVKSGAGTVVLTGANAYTGQTYIDGGTVSINANVALGAVATGAAVNLNNGALLGASTFTLDNAGANKRAIVLNGVGGTLAASTSNTFTVDGAISGVGGLTIGLGTVAGTGTGTTNTAVVGDGTVVINGANSYTGVTTLNAGTLNINGQFALGGSVYGGITFNGGTLQYATAFTGNGTGDISQNAVGVAKPVTFATGGATIDTNGNSVTFAKTIGNGGTGGLTKIGTGALELQAAATYTGATVVTTGTLLLSTGNINTSSSVSVGGNGTLTLTNTTALSDTGALTLVTGASFRLDAASPDINNPTTETIASLILNGTAENPGTYTAAQLAGLPGASGINFESLNGETLTIAAVPEPGTCLAGVLLIGAAGFQQRRRLKGLLVGKMS